jgi:glycosyltransferase involved in cell wall biosynthesis
MNNIVVITPVKNEEWILERFLEVSEKFADAILILDQGSVDRSTDICSRFDKVHVLHNQDERFNEADRQRRLLEAAREMVPEPRVIMALDADEILAADALNAQGWKTVISAEPGTTLFFEKPDLYFSTRTCLRFRTPMPLAYADDGAPHAPKKIHSYRIPMPERGKRVHVGDVKILHYGLLRPNAQASKFRFYSVTENVIGTTSSAFARRGHYSTRHNYTLAADSVESSPNSWFKRWQEAGIDMHTVNGSQYYWYDFEVLRHFRGFGERRFWLDDIWDFDWEACRQFGIEQGLEGLPERPIMPAPMWLKPFANVGSAAYLRMKELKNRMMNRNTNHYWI